MVGEKRGKGWKREVVLVQWFDGDGMPKEELEHEPHELIVVPHED